MAFCLTHEMASTTYHSPFQNVLNNKGLLQNYLLEQEHQVCYFNFTI